ncbi:MAG TPA: ABC transporter ATP-binding protein [Planctomycetota bacterium]|nr:ABC transporter ATP-binding protein [Planctomycetota bacterium]
MIEVRGFTKRYEQFMAVDHLDLKIEKGDVFGFIGPNGAGKTTTIRFLATLLKPTSGSARINGYDVNRQVDDVKRSIGFMPDAFGMYDGMKVWEFLDFFATAYGLVRSKRRALIDDVLTLVDLNSKRDTLVNGLSKGMQQRLCLAKTLVHDPPVLILDEPASGLDPRARVEMKALLKELQKMGKTILVSSHILPELADFCNKIGIIERGKLLAAGPVHEVIRSIRQNRIIEVVTSRPSEMCEVTLAHHEHVRNLTAAENRYKFEFAGNDEDVISLHRELMSHEVPLVWFNEVEADLEEAFMKITKGLVA